MAHTRYSSGRSAYVAQPATPGRDSRPPSVRHSSRRGGISAAGRKSASLEGNRYNMTTSRAARRTVQPEIWPIADKRAIEEDIDPIVDVLAQLAYRALAAPGHPPPLPRFAAPPGRHAADPSLLDYGYQGFLGRFPGLEEGREI